MTITTGGDDEMVIRQLDVDDAEAGYKLSTSAGWNQSVADWQMMLSGGEGFGAFALGRLVGSALYLPYPPDVAWVSMVLVDDAFRRRGIGSALTARCVQRIEERGLCPVLDATEAGRAVYARMGFEDGPSISRLVALDASGLMNQGGQRKKPLPAAESEVSSPTDALQFFPCTDLQTCQALDADGLGGNRDQILAHIAGRHDDACVVLCNADGPAGFGMLRRGREATQIGPVIVRPDLAGTSDFVAVAMAMLTELGSRVEGAVIVDVPDVHQPVRSALEAAGFQAKRRFVRMYRGARLQEAHAALTLATAVAIGGPAIG